MGSCCCSGQSPRDHLSTSGTTTEPLLKESEREAVSAILRFIDSGKKEKNAELRVFFVFLAA